MSDELDALADYLRENPPDHDKSPTLDELLDERFYGCAKRGCDAVNRAWESYGAYGRSWCLNHPPLRVRLRRLLGEDI